MRIDGGTVSRAMRTPEGATQLRVQSKGSMVEAEAWGPGAGWIIDALPDLVGATDRPETFRPRHRIVREMHRRSAGMRQCRCPTVCEILVPIILEQKVTTVEALRSYRALVLAWGEPAPGPPGLRLPPAACTLARMPYQDWHRFGIERRRAETIRGACARTNALERLAAESSREAQRKLTSMPGIGPWTAAEVARVALGDTDAVRLGDYHLPHIVSWALAAEPRADDQRMMELLEPYRGQRARAVRLIELSGISPPRRAPRQRLRAIGPI
jgi:3-methyladenine DNA glycosylase/8-oxoguanine DNA glycosylase